MSNNWFILIGLCFNIVGALFMAFHVVIKDKDVKELKSITIGTRNPILKIGIILLAIGFILQVFGLPLKTMF